MIVGQDARKDPEAHWKGKLEHAMHYIMVSFSYVQPTTQDAHVFFSN